MTSPAQRTLPLFPPPVRRAPPPVAVECEFSAEGTEPRPDVPVPVWLKLPGVDE